MEKHCVTLLKDDPKWTVNFAAKFSVAFTFDGLLSTNS